MMLEEASPLLARHLPALLNVLHDVGWDRFDIVYPPTGLKLLTVDLPREEIFSVADEEAFRTRGGDYFIRQELPRFGDLKECLITSTSLPLENQKEVQQTLREMYRITHNGRRLLKERYLAIDTNVAYLRFPSRFFPYPYAPKRFATAEDYKWVVSGVVWREVDSAIQEKYSPRDIEKLKRRGRKGPYFDSLINASTKRSRRAKAALWELNYIRSSLNGFRVGGEAYERDKEARDIQIARDYSMFSRERDVDVLLLTADRDMEYHASTEGLPTLLLKIPHEVTGRMRCSFRAISNLLCDLAETLAFVRLEGPGITIMGEWAGKDLKEQERETLLLLPESRDGRQAVKRCTQEIEISERVVEVLRSGGE